MASFLEGRSGNSEFTSIEFFYIPALLVREKGRDGSTEFDARLGSFGDRTSTFGDGLRLSTCNSWLAGFNFVAALEKTSDSVA